ncbi:MAG: DUF3037 domain-containing protein [Prolixibacteraceae bacterium]|jgi:hypothetical protein|nr:DUF3037 domain-containing protein [Prolixibacteraceae bacterium]
MISGTFKYSVLQYVPSQVLNERVNVGIVLFFAERGEVRFIYPKYLVRLKSLFHKVQEKKIRLYLDQTEKRVRALNKQDLFFVNDFRKSDDLVKFLDSEILKADDSALQFTKIYESLLYSSDYNKIVTDLQLEYFSEYNQKATVSHITESDLRRLFERDLKVKAPDIINRIQKDYRVSTENNEFVFDYAWQNGTFNLVKPVSFDLLDAKKIQEKSILLYGNLNLLADISRIRNYKFDLIIAKPSARSVFKSFDSALKTIDKADVSQEIIYSSEISSYTQSAIDYLSR